MGLRDKTRGFKRDSSLRRLRSERQSFVWSSRRIPKRLTGRSLCYVVLAGEFDVGGVGVGGGEDFAAFAELLEVGDEYVAKIVLGVVATVAIGDAAGHVRRISEIAGTGFLDDDEIFFHDAARNPKPSGAKITTNTT